MRQAYSVFVGGQCPKHGEWVALTPLILAHDHCEAVAAGVRNGAAPHVECPPNCINRAIAAPIALEALAEAARELTQEEG